MYGRQLMYVILCSCVMWFDVVTVLLHSIRNNHAVSD